MKLCLVGLDNLPVVAPEFRQHTIGGESVQQTLLAKALAVRGHDVSMVVSDYGQSDSMRCASIRVLKAFRPEAGLPVFRFVHPRWTGLWSALGRADADIYYTSCAGAQVGLMALFCRRFGKRFVFRVASDTDCDRSRLLVQYARDRWLYAYGLRRADAILVQTTSQAATLERSYGLRSRVAGMFVEAGSPASNRDVDVLWISNMRRLKRPDRVLELADALPAVRFHVVGGPARGEEPLFHDIKDAASAKANVSLHGRLSYFDANALYDRSKVLVNTSDIEGFPNSYLQAWIRGVPVVALLDPDGVIERQGLGIAAKSPAELPLALARLLSDPTAWSEASARCRAYMGRHYGEDRILATYLDTFEQVMSAGGGHARSVVPSRAHHV